MSLTVAVIEAKNVPNPETFGKSDPYAQIEFQGKKKAMPNAQQSVNTKLTCLPIELKKDKKEARKFHVLGLETYETESQARSNMPPRYALQRSNACLSTINHVIHIFVYDVINNVYITLVADCFRRTVQKEF